MKKPIPVQLSSINCTRRTINSQNRTPCKELIMRKMYNFFVLRGRDWLYCTYYTTYCCCLIRHYCRQRSLFEFLRYFQYVQLFPRLNFRVHHETCVEGSKSKFTYLSCYPYADRNLILCSGFLPVLGSSTATMARRNEKVIVLGSCLNLEEYIASVFLLCL